jgi:CheY-like chemotaxis protein
MKSAAESVRNPWNKTFLHRNRLRDVDVVLVDDDQEARKLLAGVLRAAGANVVPVESATSALETIDRKQPDVVITDIAMRRWAATRSQRATRSRNTARR